MSSSASIARNVLGRISGTGLGLAGVKQIIEQHGGAVQVVSLARSHTGPPVRHL
jgi:signal transduction histidine kinase